MADPAQIKALCFQERDEMLRSQIAGCLMYRAALQGVT
jgi:hypothetical protein